MPFSRLWPISSEKSSNVNLKTARFSVRQTSEILTSRSLRFFLRTLSNFTMAFHIPPGALSSLNSPGTRGLIFGLTAAVFYGLIPTFTLPICGEMGQDNPNAMTTMSILFYRFMIASVIMAGLMLIKRRSFRISLSTAGWDIASCSTAYTRF